MSNGEPGDTPFDDSRAGFFNTGYITGDVNTFDGSLLVDIMSGYSAAQCRNIGYFTARHSQKLGHGIETDGDADGVHVKMLLGACNRFPGLIDPGDLLNPINQDETGATIASNFAVWTGTDEWGDPTGFECLAWSAAFPTEEGSSGRADRTRRAGSRGPAPGP